MGSNVRIIAALWFMVLVNYLERVAVGFAGPSMMEGLGIGPDEFGLVLSSFGIGYLLAQIPGGLVADRIGAKALLVIGPLLWALFTGLTGLASSLIALIIVRVCFGFSEGLSNTSMYKMIGDSIDPKDRSKVLGICTTAIPLAPAFAGGLIGALVVSFGWQAMFLFMTIPALLVSLVCYFLLPGTIRFAGLPGRGPMDSRAEQTASISFGQLLKQPSLWLFSLAAFAWNIPYWGFLGWMPSYLSISQGIDIKSVGLLGSLIYVFAFFGLLAGGWLGSTLFENRCPQLIAVFFGCAGLGLIAAYNGHTLAVVIGGLSVAAFFLFGASAPVGKTALDMAPANHRAAYVGTYNTTGHLGGALAPAAIGWLVQSTSSFASGFGLMVAGLAVAAFCFLCLASASRARQAYNLDT